MKKIITLCLFVFAMLLGTESLTAQNSLKDINANAQEKTESLSKHLNLNGTQKDKVYKAFREYGRYKMNIDNGSINSEEITIEKIKTKLDSKMQMILSEDQYEKYKILKKQES